MTAPNKAVSSPASASGFSALYDATAVDLLAYLLRRTRTPEDAADCLAETFLVAWNKRDSLPIHLDEARRWLFGVARNVLKRDWKRESRASAAKAELARELHGAQRPIREDDPVTAALRQLPPIDREIIEMLAWDQLAPREVAAILELSPNVVRIRAHRARLKLREALESQSRVRQTNG
jgi:RNA polymerase sigma-70 factor (ECF subfamily)